MQNQKQRAIHLFKNIMNYEKIRFAAVGIINTIVDFGILLILSIVFAFPVVAANFFSTGTALIVSYVLNKKAVFGSREPHNFRQIVLFVIVTISGLWILQTIIITTSLWLLSEITTKENSALMVVEAKILASIVTIIWNYILYRNVVFKRGH